MVTTRTKRRRCDGAQARLGAWCEAAQTTFRVFAPSAQTVKVIVADHPAGAAGLAEHDMTVTPKGIWEVIVAGNLEGKYYAYKLSGTGFDPKREVVDIYATCAQAADTRSLIVDLSKTDPPGFCQACAPRPQSPVDAVVYEMHVRDFTIAPSSGARHRGQYLGLTETGTHLPRHPDIKTGLDHLKELGVTHVQLMPIQAFDKSNVENDNEYNWGYMPIHYHSPEGWLATSTNGPTRIRELKSAIQKLHEAGINVIMDVVYNHTSPLASFERLAPGYYYRFDRQGKPANGSGCGNEFRSQRPIARRFILDSLVFWVREYMIDGFRFDVMGLIDVDTMKQIRAELTRIDPGILVFGEPWAAGPTLLRKQSNKHRVAGTGIGAFNDDFRDAIKGDRDGGPPGFIQAGDRAHRVQHGLAGVAPGWPMDPADTINYFECHDNLTAWDKLLQSTPHASDDLRKRMMRFGAMILFSAQGAVFIQAGQEFCRTKRGHANSYNLPDEINQLDWSLKRENADVCAYVRGLIALRKQHPAFRLRTRDEVEKRVSFLDPPSRRCLIGRLLGRGLAGESANWILVLLNGEAREVTFKLPRAQWSVHADADRVSTIPLGHVSGELRLPAHSGIICMA